MYPITEIPSKLGIGSTEKALNLFKRSLALPTLLSALALCFQPISANATYSAVRMSTDYREIARQKAQKYGLLPQVFERQIQAESGFNPKAVSSAGATGIAQIMPGTAKGWGVNPNDPVASLDAAAKNMAGYIKTYLGGKAPGQETDPVKLREAYEKGLRAYNAGPGAVEASKRYAETNRYVQKIIGPDNFSFTEALQNKPAAKPQETAARGRTFIIFGDEEAQKDPASYLDEYIFRNIASGTKPQLKSGIDPAALLTAAFSQTPNYLEG